MEQASSSTEPKEQKKSTKKRAPNKIDVLEKRIEQLEYTIRMMGHYNGTNRVLDECGLERWEPELRHMRKHG